MIENTSIPLFTYTFQNNFSVSFEVVGIDAEFNPTTEVLTITNARRDKDSTQQCNGIRVQAVVSCVAF